MKNMKTIKYVLLGLIMLFTIPAFGSEVQITNNNSDSDSDSDLLAISLYSGIGNGFDVNLGGQLKGIGTELMYNNFSVNLGFGECDNCLGSSIGIKMYNSGVNSKNKVFAGLNYMKWIPLDNTSQVSYYYNYTITAGYRHTYSNGIYFSPYVGGTLYNTSPCLGLNVGYQFKPIHLD
jgi:hypothetical protein